MIANFLQSDLLDEYKISFSHRNTEVYLTGLSKRVKTTSAKFVPMYLPGLPKFLYLNKFFPTKLAALLALMLRVSFGLIIFAIELATLTWLLLRLKPDILHINNGGYPGAISARAAAIAGWVTSVPIVIMVVNNLAVDYTRFSRKMEYPIDRMVARSVHAFVTSSKEASKRLSQLLRLSPKIIFSFHNGVKCTPPLVPRGKQRKLFGIDASKTVVLGMVAVFEKRKGHHVLLEAVDMLVKKGINSSDFHVLIEGEGGGRQELVALVKKKRLMKFVSFVGHQKDIASFMAACDIIVLPSIKDEDFPNVVIEGMSLSKLIIASEIAGTAEQIDHNKTGILVPPNNPTELAFAIESALEQPEKIKILAKAARKKYVKHFSEELSVERYVNFYERLLSDA